jgi:tRNA threonylcarbamoyladenosine biosynthesis protein TsaE
MIVLAVRRHAFARHWNMLNLPLNFRSASTHTCTLTSPTPESTHALGLFLGSRCVRGDIISLIGTLGAGKSVFARGLVRGAVGDGSVEVPSPTYLLSLLYTTRPPLSMPVRHIDAYRLPKDERNIGFLGLEESYQNGLTILEWAERLPPTALPSSSPLLRVFIATAPYKSFTPTEDGEIVLEEDTLPRTLTFRGDGPRAVELVEFVAEHHRQQQVEGNGW